VPTKAFVKIEASKCRRLLCSAGKFNISNETSIVANGGKVSLNVLKFTVVAAFQATDAYSSLNLTEAKYSIRRLSA
jgi:hypothetical protein